MSNSSTDSYQTLPEHLRQVLHCWHQRAQEESPIDYLYLFQEALTGGEKSVQEAHNQILQNALEKLAETHDQDAHLLRRRFETDLKVRELAAQMNVVESTIYLL